MRIAQHGCWSLSSGAGARRLDCHRVFRERGEVQGGLGPGTVLLGSSGLEGITAAVDWGVRIYLDGKPQGGIWELRSEGA